MRLNELKIHRPLWGEHVGKVIGEVKFENAHGNITLQLTEDHCKEILQVCAVALVDSAKQSATQLTAAIIDAAAPVVMISTVEIDEANGAIKGVMNQ